MFTIGADPEFFIANGNGRAVPIVGLLGGTKEAPIPMGGGYAVQEDNVMAEYNVPPTDSYEQFAHSIARGRDLALSIVQIQMPRVTAHKDASVLFSREQLSNPQARLFGCSPDFNAYEQGRPLPRINPDLLTEGKGEWRFAGGHIHLGYKDTLSWKLPDFVVAALCDLMISIPMIAYGYDNQGTRRKFYGTPGRFRPTKYGIEYRTLCNKWTLTERAAMAAGMCAINTMSELDKGEAHIRTIYNDMPWEDVRRAINNEDSDLADNLRRYARNAGLEVI